MQQDEEETTIFFQANSSVGKYGISLNHKVLQPSYRSLLVTNHHLKIDNLPDIPFAKISLHAVNTDENTNISYLYCQISDFPELSGGDAAADSFDELQVQVDESELYGLYEAMNKAAELTPYVPEDGEEDEEGDWIYNEDEVRKGSHLHPRDQDDSDQNAKRMKL